MPACAPRSEAVADLPGAGGLPNEIKAPEPFMNRIQLARAMVRSGTEKHAWL